jgi:proline dehydrogenase
MIDALAKATFHTLSRSRTLKRVATRYGLAPSGGFARRFIAGESLEEVVAAARQIESRGLSHTLDYLGESVTTIQEAGAATEEYLLIIERVVAAGVGRNISLKLTQLGLDLGRSPCLDHLRRIVTAGAAHDFFVRIDMENSPYIDATLDIFETLWGEGLRNVGVVLQSALHRTDADLERLLALGARVRLVKGAYKEPAAIAWQRKADVDAAFLRQMERLLLRGRFPAIATHDEVLIDAAKALAARHGVGREAFEFQLLYGIRRDLQNALREGGYGVRVYIPFGREWFPYFMRRLGERPANVGFVLRGLLRERGGNRAGGGTFTP